MLNIVHSNIETTYAYIKEKGVSKMELQFSSHLVPSLPTLNRAADTNANIPTLISRYCAVLLRVVTLNCPTTLHRQKLFTCW